MGQNFLQVEESYVDIEKEIPSVRHRDIEAKVP